MNENVVSVMASSLFLHRLGFGRHKAYIVVIAGTFPGVSD
jgi:hypothetical protein